MVSGTPKQQSAADFAAIFGFQWTQAAFEVLRVNGVENWTLTLRPDSITTLTYTASSGTVAGLTSALADLIDTRFLPVVSGYTASFNTPWPAEIRSTVILSGQPVVGDLWSVALDIAGHTKTFSHTIVADDTLEAIATALANAVKADQTGNLSAEAAGVALVILNNAGNTENTRFTISRNGVVLTPVVDQGSIDSTTASSAMLTLQGSPVVSEAWTVRLEYGPATARVSRIVSYTVGIDAAGVADSRGAIAAGLAAGINALLGADFGATSDGEQLIIVKRSAGSFDVTFQTGAAAFGSGNATAASLTLFGTPAIGEHWTVSLSGVSFVVTVDATLNTPAAIAAALAAAINADTSAQAEPYTALAEGARLVVVNRTGAAFTPAFAIVPASGATVDTATPVAALVQIASSLLAGETWTLLITVDGAMTPVSHTAAAAETPEQVAQSLATLVNANTMLGDFTATAEGASLVLVNRAGHAFTFGNSASIDATTPRATLVTLAGQPVAGETWTLTLDSAAYTSTVGTGATTLAQIAADLAAQVNSDTAAASFTATSDGALLVLVKRDGGSFTTSVQVAAAGSVSAPSRDVDIATTDVHTMQITLSGAVTAGDAWRIELTLGGVTRVADATVTGGLNALATDLATAVSHLTGFTASASGPVITINSADGASYTTAVTRKSTAATAEVAVTSAVHTAQVTLRGTVVTADAWQIALTVGAGTRFALATAASSLDQLAADLAAAVSAIDGFSATASGAVITISSTNATSFGTAVNANMRAYTFALGGAAVTGEVWTVTVAGQEHSVTVGGAIDTLAKIAAAVASAIQGDTLLADYAAAAKGNSIVIAKLSAGEFSPSLAIAPAGNISTGASASARSSRSPVRRWRAICGGSR